MFPLQVSDVTSRSVSDAQMDPGEERAFARLDSNDLSGREGLAVMAKDAKKYKGKRAETVNPKQIFIRNKLKSLEGEGEI